MIAWKPRVEPSIIPSAPPPPRVSDAPAGMDRDDPPVSSRVTRADPIEAETRAAQLRSAPSTPPEAEAPFEQPASESARSESPASEKPASVPPLLLDSAKASLSTAPAPPAVAAAAPSPAQAAVPPSIPPRGSEVPPDGGRRILTALVGITGAAVGIAVVAIVFATRSTPPPSVPGGSTAVAPTVRPAATATSAAAPAPSASTAAPEPATITVTMEVSPSYARVYLDKARIKPPYDRTLPRDGADHELKIEAPGHKSKKIPFKATGDLSLVIALEALPKKKKNPTTNEEIY